MPVNRTARSDREWQAGDDDAVILRAVRLHVPAARASIEALASACGSTAFLARAPRVLAIKRGWTDVNANRKHRHKLTLGVLGCDLDTASADHVAPLFKRRLLANRLVARLLDARLAWRAVEKRNRICGRGVENEVLHVAPALLGRPG